MKTSVVRVIAALGMSLLLYGKLEAGLASPYLAIAQPCSPETGPNPRSGGNPNRPPAFQWESDADKEDSRWCLERSIMVDTSVTRRVKFLWVYKDPDNPLLAGSIKYGDPPLYNPVRGLERGPISPEPLTDLWYGRTLPLKVQAYVSPDEAAAGSAAKSRISAAGQLAFEYKNEPYTLTVSVVSEDQEVSPGNFEYIYTLTVSRMVPASFYWSSVAFQAFYDKLQQTEPDAFGRTKPTLKTAFRFPRSQLRVVLDNRKEKPTVRAGSLTIRDEKGEILAAFSAPAIVPQSR